MPQPPHSCQRCLRLVSRIPKPQSRSFQSCASRSLLLPSRYSHKSPAKHVCSPHPSSSASSRPLPARLSSSSAASSDRPTPSFGQTTSYSPTTGQYETTGQAHGDDGIERTLQLQNNLFHSFSNSPSPSIRRRAAFMRQHAYCPHPSHQRTRQPTAPFDLENRKPEASASSSASPPAHVRFECPDCGIPVACCKEHWEDDYEAHLEICETLREINEDDHDLRSGRFFQEFQYPGPQRADEFVINLSNWDTFLYTRDFNAMDDPRNIRQATRLLTYPTTITSVLHDLSPYDMRKDGRLTQEGLRSFSALRYTLHPPGMGEGSDKMVDIHIRPPPVRIFVLGARAESSLPREVWLQLTHCFPRSSFNLILIGPEAMANRDREFPLPERTPLNPFGGIVEDRLSHGMKITTFVEYFHTMHNAGHFAPYDPYFDVFVLFHPGLGHPASVHEWAETLPQLLETKCPIISTGYTEWDMERDRSWVEQKMGGEVDILLEPGENRFRSLRWDLNDLDPNDISCGNWGVWAFRGKRYEAMNRDAEAIKV